MHQKWVRTLWQRGAPVWIGTPITFLILPPDSSFKYKKKKLLPFHFSYYNTVLFNVKSTWGLLFLEPVIPYKWLLLSGVQTEKTKRKKRRGSHVKVPFSSDLSPVPIGGNWSGHRRRAVWQLLQWAPREGRANTNVGHGSDVPSLASGVYVGLLW